MNHEKACCAVCGESPLEYDQLCVGCLNEGIQKLDPAIEKGDLTTIKRMAKDPKYPLESLLNAQFKKVTPFGWRPTTLFLECVENYISEEHEDILKLFLDHGADPNFQNVYGDTALSLACRQVAGQGVFWLEMANVVSILLQAGADPNTNDPSGCTPLMHAAINGDYPVVKTLLDSKKIEKSVREAQLQAETRASGKAGIGAMRFKEPEEELADAASRYEKVANLLRGYPSHDEKEDEEEESDILVSQEDEEESLGMEPDNKLQELAPYFAEGKSAGRKKELVRAMDELLSKWRQEDQELKCPAGHNRMMRARRKRIQASSANSINVPS